MILFWWNSLGMGGEKTPREFPVMIVMHNWDRLIVLPVCLWAVNQEVFGGKCLCPWATFSYSDPVSARYMCNVQTTLQYPWVSQPQPRRLRMGRCFITPSTGGSIEFWKSRESIKALMYSAGLFWLQYGKRRFTLNLLP
nr:uncharacterized protein LOC128688592 [Cherax quadricarinatus]